MFMVSKQFSEQEELNVCMLCDLIKATITERL